MILVLLGLVAVGTPQKYREEFHPVNETGRLHAAMAVVDHGTVRLDEVWDEVYPDWRESGRLPNADAAVRDDRYLLDKPPGVTFLEIPLVGGFRVAGIEPSLPVVLWLAALLFAALPAVVFLLVFSRWIGGNLPEGSAARLVAPAVVLASPWLLFGSQAVAHSLAAALAGLGLLFGLGGLDPDVSDERPRGHALFGGFLLGYAVLAELSVALLAVGAAVALAVDPARRRRLPWLLLGGLGPALALLGWNALSFGSPFAYGYEFKASAGMAQAHGRGFLGIGLPTAEAVTGLLLSARRGLFFLAPWLLLAPVGAVLALCDRRVTRAWRVVLVAGIYLCPLVLAGFSDWHGGGTLGPRYLIFLLPVFGVAAALAVARFERSAGGRKALAAAGGLLLTSLLLQLAANAGIPSADQLVANPLKEVVFPVLFQAGPVGTIEDPLTGSWAGAAIAAGAAVVLLLWIGRPALRALRDSTWVRQGNLVWFLVAAVAVHGLFVAVPRTREPPDRAVVLRARWQAYRYMDDREHANEVAREILRIENPGAIPR